MTTNPDTTESSVSGQLPGHEWDAHAQWWQDEFSEGADPEYVEQILPLIAERLVPEGTLLDVGCGEGQIARLAEGAGLVAYGIDPSGAQVIAARERGQNDRFSIGSAEDIPFENSTFDMAIACLVFEHIPDATKAISEVARVLKPGGTFLFLLNHPLLQTPDSGWIEDYTVDPPLAYWQIGEYLTHAETHEEVEAGVFIRFFHRPLSLYINAAIGAGLNLVEMLEPAPPPGFLERAPGYMHGAAIPRLLALRFVLGTGE